MTTWWKAQRSFQKGTESQQHSVTSSEGSSSVQYPTALHWDGVDNRAHASSIAPQQESVRAGWLDKHTLPWHKKGNYQYLAHVCIFLTWRHRVSAEKRSYEVFHQNKSLARALSCICNSSTKPSAQTQNVPQHCLTLLHKAAQHWNETHNSILPSKFPGNPTHAHAHTHTSLFFIILASGRRQYVGTVVDIVSTWQRWVLWRSQAFNQSLRGGGGKKTFSSLHINMRCPCQLREPVLHLTLVARTTAASSQAAFLF